jgi:16S rRNA processing protein RimM
MIPPVYAQGDPTGSRGTGEPVFLAVGQLVRLHGLNGNLVLRICTDFPERLQKGVQVFLGEDHLPFEIEDVRWFKSDLLLRFRGVSTREAAERLKNLWVMVRVEDLPSLPDGEDYHHQLIGLAVITNDNQELGRVMEIIGTGANDVLIVRSENAKEILLPVIDDVLLNIDLGTRTIHVNLLPGTIPD